MSEIDWREKGRAAADEICFCRSREWIAAQLERSVDMHKRFLCMCYDHLLTAVRWDRGGEEAKEGPCLKTEAIRLLVDGFRARLAELAEERKEIQQP